MGASSIDGAMVMRSATAAFVHVCSAIRRWSASRSTVNSRERGNALAISTVE